MDGTRPNLRINSDRLWARLHEMAQIGPGVAGGNNRQSLTDADGAARHLFQHWCEEAGLDVSVDQMGNMFARREGSEAGAAPVCVGSHLDTQPTGGKYDGVLGVLGGLEIISSLNDLGIQTRHPIEVVNWTNEEGTRFAPAMLASGVFAGVHDQDWAYKCADADGKQFGAELARIGWKGGEPTGGRDVHAFFELHIEQGPILEADSCDVGIVTHAQGLFWLEITLTGHASHTGTTPMTSRRDAALGMARIIAAVHEMALQHQPDAVGTVGHVDVSPNSRNVIAETATFTVDFRSPDADILVAAEAQIRTCANKIAGQLGLQIAIEKVGGYAPVEFDQGCVEALRRASVELGYRHRDMLSGAGHDACWINRVAPTAMLFCPCVDGLSHNEAEEISQAWAEAGTNVLCRAVIETAGIIQ